MNTLFIILLALTALVSSSAFFFFPAVQAEGLSAGVAIAFASSITQLLAVGFFLTSLGTFKKRLRLAYIFLAIGIFIFSLVQIVPSLSVFTDAISNNIVLAQVVILAPFLLGSLLMYAGMRTFARLLGIKKPVTSFWVAIAAAIVATVAVVSLPHQMPEGAPEEVYKIVFGSITWCVAFALLAMLVALSIRRTIGEIYKPAMLWTILALGALAFVGLHEIVAKGYFPLSSYVANSFSLWPYLLAGVLFLKAGLEFRAAGQQYIKLPENASYIDIVIGVADMVSRPVEVDEALAKVRAITVQQDSSKPLSEPDKTTLVDAYKILEGYLTTREPVRVFTVEGLRNGLPDEFLQRLKA